MDKLFKPARTSLSKASEDFTESFPYLVSGDPVQAFINRIPRIATSKEKAYVMNSLKGESCEYVIHMTDNDLTSVNKGVSIGKLKSYVDLFKVLETRNKK